jgi:RimJ/RimL family protein N-acetyltransferase
MIDVRLMTLAETPRIITYFHDATPAHLALLGVDRARLPPAATWQKLYEQDLEKPPTARRSLLVSWLDDGRFIGFSTADQISYGDCAHMHLHVVEPSLRRKGLGTALVRLSANLYFDVLKLTRLWCEPHAFNTAPNRSLQKAGFKYVKTHMSTPGPINDHQAVNTWVIERTDGAVAWR